SHGNQNITIFWNVPSLNNGAVVTGYNVYRSTTSGSGFSKIGTSLILNYTDISLSNGQIYYYKVSANNSIGEGGFSNEASATPSTIPDIPTGVLKTVGNAHVNLSWIAPFDGGATISTYKIYRSSITGGPYSLIGTSTITSYFDGGLINGNEYFYMISAVNINGEGLKSSEISAIPITTPGSPQSLTADSGNQQITLVWESPLNNGGSAITGYNIYRSTTSGSGFTKINTSTILSFTDSTGLTNGIEYFYKVTANNSIGEGTFSNEASSIPSTVPGAPQSLSVASGDNSAILGWSAPSSDGGSIITSYKIHRGDESGGPYVLISTTSSTNYTDTTVQNGNIYFWVVTAVNFNGEGTQSTEVSILVATTPGIPTGLIANSGNNNISLSWEAPNSNGGSVITNYTVYRSTTSGSGFTILTITISTSYVDASALNGQTYYYKVTANNSIGEGGFSNEASATPSTLPGAPVINNVATGDGFVILNWTVPADDGGSSITAYKVYKSTTSGTGFSLLTSTISLSIVDYTVINGITYYYKVSAVNIKGEGLQSDEAVATPATIPDPPSDLTAESGNNNVTLSWSSPNSDGGSSITGYTIYRSTTNGTGFVNTGTSVSLNYTDITVTNGITYYFKVTANNSVGQSGFSNEISSIPSQKPTAPQNLTGTSDDGVVSLSWDIPTNNGGSLILGYNVFRSTASSGPYTKIATTVILTYIDNSVTNGITYYYVITAFNIKGESVISNELLMQPIGPPTKPLSLSGLS
ncbi:MAG: fibronectin type III domain-containing protein, partial [Candidatus Kariarchaeaceae archaeon]